MHPGKQPSETWDQVQIMSRMHFITHLNRGSFISLTGLIPFGHITEIFVAWWLLRRDHQKWNSKKEDLLLPHDEKSHWSLCARCGSMFPVSRCFFFLIAWMGVCNVWHILSTFTETMSVRYSHKHTHLQSIRPPVSNLETKQWENRMTTGFNREISTPTHEDKWLWTSV